VKSLTPLLRHPSENPKASLVALYMNAVFDVSFSASGNEDTRKEVDLYYSYLGPSWRPKSNSPHDPLLCVLVTSLTLVRDGDKYFNE
jgi:hypothetical protein